MSTVPFELFPAVDIRRGRVVRLLRGEAAAETVYGRDPVAVAVDLAARGARHLHVVDLDAALGEGSGQAAILDVIRGVSEMMDVQVGGGLRDTEAVDSVLGAGARRAVLGTAALRDPAFVRALVGRHGADRIAVALDVRDGQAVGHGWVPGAPGFPVVETLDRMLVAGARRFVVTAIDRDGTLDGPDLALLAQVVAAGVQEVVASAGIRAVADLAAVAAVGCTGAIIGRALYDGRFDLAAGLAWARG